MSPELIKYPPLNDGKMLVGIYNYQLNLMKNLMVKGMLPQLNTVSIQDREGQAFLKKAIYWITEEVVEAKEVYDAIMLEYNDTGGLVSKDFEAFFGELGDVLHFMVELMIYSGIDHEDIYKYYELLAKERGLELVLTEEGLTTSINYANHTNIYDDQVRVGMYMATKLEFVSTKVSTELHLLVRDCMLEVISKLHLAGNLLKKRDWSVAEDKLTPLQQYHYKLMEAWLYFFKLCHMVGLDAQGVYNYYEKMNMKNQERIINNY